MESADDRADLIVGFFCLVAIAALLVVGVVAHEIVRHLLQSSPFWIGAMLGLRRSGLAKWAALPLMLFWLLISILIWLYLLKISNIVKGSYTPIEVSMTVILAGSAVATFWAMIVSKSRTPWWAALATVALAAAFQFVVFNLSLRPQIAHDSAVLDALSAHLR